MVHKVLWSDLQHLIICFIDSTYFFYTKRKCTQAVICPNSRKWKAGIFQFFSIYIIGSDKRYHSKTQKVPFYPSWIRFFPKTKEKCHVNMIVNYMFSAMCIYCLHNILIVYTPEYSHFVSIKNMYILKIYRIWQKLS